MPRRTHFLFQEEPATMGAHAQFAVWVGPDKEHLALAGRLTMRLGEAEHFRQLLTGAYDVDGDWQVEQRLPHERTRLGLFRGSSRD